MNELGIKSPLRCTNNEPYNVLMLFHTQKSDFGSTFIVYFVVLQQLKIFEALNHYKNKNNVE
jgi:hypothetical protein